MHSYSVCKKKKNWAYAALNKIKTIQMLTISLGTSSYKSKTDLCGRYEKMSSSHSIKDARHSCLNAYFRENMSLAYLISRPITSWWIGKEKIIISTSLTESSPGSSKFSYVELDPNRSFRPLFSNILAFLRGSLTILVNIYKTTQIKNKCVLWRKIRASARKKIRKKRSSV